MERNAETGRARRKTRRSKKGRARRLDPPTCRRMAVRMRGERECKEQPPAEKGIVGGDRVARTCRTQLQRFNSLLTAAIKVGL